MGANKGGNMKLQSIKTILMHRDGMTEEDALDLIQDAQDQFDIYINEGNMGYAEDICEEFFGLEPDYLTELLP